MKKESLKEGKEEKNLRRNNKKTKCSREKNFLCAREGERIKAHY